MEILSYFSITRDAESNMFSLNKKITMLFFVFKKDTIFHSMLITY